MVTMILKLMEIQNLINHNQETDQPTMWIDKKGNCSFSACSPSFLRVSASLSWACIWARSSCIFRQLSAYSRRTNSMMVVVIAIPTSSNRITKINQSLHFFERICRNKGRPRKRRLQAVLKILITWPGYRLCRPACRRSYLQHYLLAQIFIYFKLYKKKLWILIFYVIEKIKEMSR